MTFNYAYYGSYFSQSYWFYAKQNTSNTTQLQCSAKLK